MSSQSAMSGFNGTPERVAGAHSRHIAPPEGPADAELVRLVIEGDRRAFDQLVLRHQDRIYNALLRHTGSAEDALDLAQQTFLNAFQKISLFRGQSNFSTWLTRIAFNLAASHYRSPRGRKTMRLEEEFAHALPDRDRRSDPVRWMEDSDTERLVQAAIAALDVESRAIVVMREFENFSYEEIAQVLGLPVGTVRSKLHRARVFLQSRLSQVIGNAAGSSPEP